MGSTLAKGIVSPGQAACASRAPRVDQPSSSPRAEVGPGSIGRSTERPPPWAPMWRRASSRGAAAVAEVGVEVDHPPASASRPAWAATLRKACAYWLISSSAGRVKAGSWIVSYGTSGSSLTGRVRPL